MYIKVTTRDNESEGRSFRFQWVPYASPEHPKSKSSMKTNTD